MNNLGYTKKLFILPFDHRGSLVKSVFGEVGELTSFEKQEIILQKNIIYEAFKKAMDEGLPPRENAAVLVDEEYGKDILEDAKRQGFKIVLTTEESGIKEFIFEYGEDFKTHIEHYNPLFVKALFYYKDELKPSEKENLKTLSDYCHDNGHKLLLEVVTGDLDSQTRSAKLLKTILDFQTENIEPDIWKIEGMDKREHYENVLGEMKKNDRKNVSAIILGRGEDKHKVEEWILQGKNVDGIIGFAIGRTVFSEPLLELRDGKISREQTVGKIAKNYQYFYNLFNS
ncbi:MAG TPA: DUF2090 domain-containing protein [Patescibacteria group bacterium]|nr:DUF2090 domain-containing protein [Patescibacteria group bacterium]